MSGPLSELVYINTTVFKSQYLCIYFNKIAAIRAAAKPNALCGVMPVRTTWYIAGTQTWTTSTITKKLLTSLGDIFSSPLVNINNPIDAKMLAATDQRLNMFESRPLITSGVIIRSWINTKIKAACIPGSPLLFIKRGQTLKNSPAIAACKIIAPFTIYPSQTSRYWSRLLNKDLIQSNH
ncbi:MAG: hypothetical protein A3B86_00555 [Candidatus Yanofskybacteria bacterium RIFCSPHIGHO2_02_FULL_38_22b]|uniref:Uncharacterized protein n=1 Tax=Candidatus Yanofskybacteria bacterium RIFCSPHIGHO2_02_FULL_38_22b TaxID=1802673 RepID=A0A1F8F358_9BACT|nr:MAG: hypothetical protein A3B86_00555 [Candidatus Yanofskybacteria bacterium RIFCSPHIGHO2_02_FULL_38_22b]OGN20200.1 MAG: hypothetical protein A2910_00090 [Candidatus Yanofskybacteria bacterium RIFCSPLOWO2_01_FULL_39_28]